MFSKNRLMILHDEELILVYFNGIEVFTIYDSWDSIDAFKMVIDIFNKLSPDCRKKDIKFLVVDTNDIDIDEDAKDLLYSVQQFTQEEERAFFTSDWKKLNELLLQRIEDGKME